MVTLIIKTFERSKELRRLLDSMNKFTQNYPVIIADDSKIKDTYSKDYYNLTLLDLEYDSGISLSRNEAVKRCNTEYCVILEDDFVFTAETDIKKLLNLCIEAKADIMGGAIYNENGILNKYFGNLDYENNYLIQRPVEVKGDYINVDMVSNFFIARTEWLKTHKWDNRLKLCEHTEFFYRHHGKGKVCYTPLVSINHFHSGTEEYTKLRRRSEQYKYLMLDITGLSGIIGFKGKKVLDKADKNEKR